MKSQEQKAIIKIRKAKKALENELKAKQKRRLLEVLNDNDVDNGFTLPELAGKVLDKNYVSEADKKEVYQILTAIRKDTNECLAFRNGKYGWAKDKETIDLYRLANISNGLKKVKSNINKLPKNYAAIGIQDSPYPLINAKVKEFGVKFLGYNKTEV